MQQLCVAYMWCSAYVSNAGAQQSLLHALLMLAHSRRQQTETVSQLFLPTWQVNRGHKSGCCAAASRTR